MTSRVVVAPVVAVALVFSSVAHANPAAGRAAAVAAGAGAVGAYSEAKEIVRDIRSAIDRQVDQHFYRQTERLLEKHSRQGYLDGLRHLERERNKE